MVEIVKISRQYGKIGCNLAGEHLREAVSLTNISNIDEIYTSGKFLPGRLSLRNAVLGQVYVNGLAVG